MNDCSCGNGLCQDCARDMRTVILRVRQLHRPVKPHPRGLEVCESCSELRYVKGPTARAGGAVEHRAGVAYPCATIRTLGDAG